MKARCLPRAPEVRARAVVIAEPELEPEVTPDEDRLAKRGVVPPRPRRAGDGDAGCDRQRVPPLPAVLHPPQFEQRERDNDRHEGRRQVERKSGERAKRQ
jgi:hypothetical protein